MPLPRLRRIAGTATCSLALAAAWAADTPPPDDAATAGDGGAATAGNGDATPAEAPAFPEFAAAGIEWLVAAQHEDGGWGAGSHAKQQIRDPHAVPSDPATTAFVATTFMRLGNTLEEGDHAEVVRDAITYLVDTVDAAPSQGTNITHLEGTQIQTKLGPMIDTALTAQCLARTLNVIAEDDALRDRVDVALDICLSRLAAAQQEAGHWGGGGWAPVLQTDNACAAFELAQAAGKTIDQEVLTRARDWQTANARRPRGEAAGGAGGTAAFMALGARGGAGAPADAGVELYSFSGGQRANVVRSKAAERLLDEAKDDGRVDEDAEVSEETMVEVLQTEDPEQSEEEVRGRAAALAESYELNRQQKARILEDDKLVAGYGSNGGEEYLSYMRTSEALLLDGGEEFAVWQNKMHARLAKAQVQDGSWTGHHCITSPVFCTAAVLQCLSVENDRELLAAIEEHGVAEARAEVGRDRAGEAVSPEETTTAEEKAEPEK